MAEATSPPTGYRLLLPSGWVQIPLRQSKTEEIVHRIVTDAFRRAPGDIPRDKLTPLRLEMERRLRAAIADARKAKALEIYLPMRLSGEMNLGASIVVSEARLPSHSAPDASDVAVSHPTEVAARLISRSHGTELDLSSGEIDGALAVRQERVMPADPGHGAEMASRRVDYLVSVPGDPSRWFVAAFSTIGAGNPQDDLADALVEWFDALMATFRWSWA
ncbi:hypothetical protein ACFCXS_08190 [Streptomyces sp. NPDC056373]|uniref:hypothetical protein n=1 Tax=Streptomyces sp. NPDC056373 TaxID=3345798 RepID=UPI0035DF5B5B